MCRLPFEGFPWKETLSSNPFKVDCGMGDRSGSPELCLIFGICSVPLPISCTNAEFFIK